MYDLSGSFEQAMTALRARYAAKCAAEKTALTPEAISALVGGGAGALAGAANEYGKKPEDRSYLRGLLGGGAIGAGLGYAGNKGYQSLAPAEKGPGGVSLHEAQEAIGKDQSSNWPLALRRGVDQAIKGTGTVLNTVTDAAVPNRTLLGGQAAAHQLWRRNVFGLGDNPLFGSVRPDNSNSLGQLRAGLSSVIDPQEGAKGWFGRARPLPDVGLSPTEATTIRDAINHNSGMAQRSMDEYAAGRFQGVTLKSPLADPARPSPRINVTEDTIKQLLARGEKPFQAAPDGRVNFNFLGKQRSVSPTVSRLGQVGYYAVPQIVSHLLTPELPTNEDANANLRGVAQQHGLR
jgi:hypothetical protein